jgi:hypothetical protein
MPAAGRLSRTISKFPRSQNIPTVKGEFSAGLALPARNQLDFAATGSIFAETDYVNVYVDGLGKEWRWTSGT